MSKLQNCDVVSGREVLGVLSVFAQSRMRLSGDQEQRCGPHIAFELTMRQSRHRNSLFSAQRALSLISAVVHAESCHELDIFLSLLMRFQVSEHEFIDEEANLKLHERLPQIPRPYLKSSIMCGQRFVIFESTTGGNN